MSGQIYTCTVAGEGPWHSVAGVVMRQTIRPGSAANFKGLCQIQFIKADDASVCRYDSFFIGHGTGGGSPNFGDVPVQITVGGQTTFDIPGGGGVVLSDPFEFRFDGVRDVVMGMGYSGSLADNAPTSWNHGNGDTNFLNNQGLNWAGQAGAYPVWFTSGRLPIGGVQTYGDLPPPAPPGLKASEARSFAIFRLASPEARASEARSFGIINFPTPQMRASQVRVIIPEKSQTKPVEVSEARTFAIVKGRTANPHVRAWTCTLDGHDFYVLRLGDEITLVYDVASEQWVDWDSMDSGAWRPNIGTNWVGGQALANVYGSSIIVGDDTFGRLWFLDPSLPFDQTPDLSRAFTQLPFMRIVTGQVLAKGRQFLPCYALFLDGDNYGLVAQDFTPSVTLETSDDQGRTWDTHETLVMVASPQQDDAYSWTSLGQISSPGRIFRVTDNGLFARLDTMGMNDDAG